MSTLLEGLRIALTSIVANRTRAALTTLGIIIGVAAVISLVSLGRGVEKFVKDQFNSLGANMLIVVSQEPESDTRTRIEPLTTSDVENLTGAESIEQIAAQYNISGVISDDGEHMRTTVRGVSANYMEVRNWEPTIGEFISPQDVATTQRVVLLGPDVVEELYDDTTFDPTGRVVRINDLTFTVIGVMEKRDDPFNNDNGALLIPISTGQTRMATARTRGGYEVHQLYVQAISEEATYAAEEEMEAYFIAAHDIETEDERDFDITNMGEQLEIAGTITALLTVFLGIIAGVSLLVGGIGIMNIMLVTVTERTKEIGLRKALGARPRDILIQFLFESVILSLVGGATCCVPSMATPHPMRMPMA
ncbi:MAG: ABC transporter permease, partial [Chloroflexota bacterium]